MNNKIECHVDKHTKNHLIVSFYNKCFTHKINTNKVLKIATAEFKIPDMSTIESVFYCINSKNKGERHGILGLYENKKIIELAKFKYHDEEQDEISKNIICSVLPVLKLYNYLSLIIRSKNVSKIYEDLGMESFKDSKFIVDIIDAISSINMGKVLKNPKKQTNIKDTIISEWMSKNNDELIYIGSIDKIQKKLDLEYIPSRTIFSQ